MPATENKLFVFAHLDGDWVPAGQLTLTEDGARLEASSFSYGLRYLERPTAIEIDPVTLSLNDRASIRGKALFPAEGLRLSGGIRDAAPDAWGRRVIEAKLKVPGNSLPESEYLIHAGSQRVGALDIRRTRSDDPVRGYGTWDSLQYLMDAAQKIDDGEPIPANLAEIFSQGSALGGARPKANVRDENQVLWLAKFVSRNDSLDVPVIEMATMRLAAEAGLNVPAVRLVTLGNRAVMLIRRFDRYWAAVGKVPENLMTTEPGKGLVEKRLPFVSGLTLLACDEMDSPSKSYGDLAHAIRRYCHPSFIREDNRELYGRLVFNVLVSNDDDHLRNHGFFWDPRVGGWRLSPLYDVMPRATHASERQLHLGVGPRGRLATLDNAFAGREVFTLSADEATAVIGRVWEAVRKWKDRFAAWGVPAQQIEKVAPAFRALEHVASQELLTAIAGNSSPS